MKKREYKPDTRCCNHFKTDSYTVGYLANRETGKPSRFKVFICDNCGEAQIFPYKGLKALFAELYFKYISQGCVCVYEKDRRIIRTMGGDDEEKI